MENKREEEAEEQQQYNEQYDTVPKMTLVYEAIRTKQFRLTENLNGVNTKMIMANLCTTHWDADRGYHFTFYFIILFQNLLSVDE